MGLLLPVWDQQFPSSDADKIAKNRLRIDVLSCGTDNSTARTAKQNSFQPDEQTTNSWATPHAMAR
jgi:hypothetical protein